MPTRESAPVGAPIWVDVMSTDVEVTRSFYGELFGWTSDEPNPEMGGYFNFYQGGVRIAGGMSATPPEGQDVWSVHLNTEDAAKTVELAVANGGQVIVPVMPVMDLGTMAAVSDPSGAMIGSWQPGTHKGFGIMGEPGAPSWFELLTRDYQRAVPFYRDVFHWETHVEGDTPEFRYTTLTISEEQYAGIMDASGFLPDGVPSHWLVYFGAADTDEALAHAVKLGGAIIDPAVDTPYGRLGMAADPNGARFKFVGPNKG
jgi:uncharacterized protein